MVSYYGCNGRKTVKWWKKVFTWILEICQVNSLILYSLAQPAGKSRASFAAFKEQLILELVQASRPPTPEPPIAPASTTPKEKPGKKVIHTAEERLNGKHLVDYDGHDRQCVYCSLQKKYKRSSYFCTGCSGRPHLCVKECFYKYHTIRNIQ